MITEIIRDNLPEALTPSHIQRILGIGRRQTYELMENPPFHVVKVGRLYKISKKSFFNWLDGDQWVNYLVVSKMTKVGTRMAIYYPNENKIIIDPRKIYQSHKRFNLSLIDYVHILIARELGRSMDRLLEERNHKIDKAFQLIKKGFGSDQLVAY